MKQLQIVKATQALDNVFKNSNVVKPMQLSFALYKLRKKLQEHLDWQFNQQNAINEKLDGEGLVGKERESAFNKELAEVVMSDVVVDWDVVTVPQESEIVINPLDFVSLEGFIDIV